MALYFLKPVSRIMAPLYYPFINASWHYYSSYITSFTPIIISPTGEQHYYHHQLLRIIHS